MTVPDPLTGDPRPLVDVLRAEADLYADYDTDHADLIRTAADRLAALEAVAEAAHALRCALPIPMGRGRIANAGYELNRALASLREQEGRQ